MPGHSSTVARKTGTVHSLCRFCAKCFNAQNTRHLHKMEQFHHRFAHPDKVYERSTEHTIDIPSSPVTDAEVQELKASFGHGFLVNGRVLARQYR
jgi:hypothetical protein